jgi:lipoate-protein ligase A
VSLPKCREGRLLLDGALPGDWNMAVDEVLLENANRGEVILRFYSWSPATVSLGYFQTVAERRSHFASRSCPLVRRPSGGGALVHGDEHHDLTYSIAVPDPHRSRNLPALLYETLHTSLVGALAQFGIVAQRAAADCQTTCKEFLCFERCTAGDVLIGDSKIAGSAQRRMPQGILQHGSVLLSQLAEAPELPGIAQLTDGPLSRAELQSAWLAELAARWPLTWRTETLSAEEIRRAKRKCLEKFTRDDWNHRR